MVLVLEGECWSQNLHGSQRVSVVFAPDQIELLVDPGLLLLHVGHKLLVLQRLLQPLPSETQGPVLSPVLSPVLVQTAHEGSPSSRQVLQFLPVLHELGQPLLDLLLTDGVVVRQLRPRVQNRLQEEPGSEPERQNRVSRKSPGQNQRDRTGSGESKPRPLSR